MLPLSAAPRAVLLATLSVGALACRSDTPAPDPITPATAAEAEAFGQAMAKALAPCDPAAVAALVDAKNLARRAARGRKAPKAAKEGLIAGATGEVLGTNLCRELGGEDTTATYLRSRTTSGSPRPLLRVIIGEGVNYLEFEVGRIKGAGEVRAIDVLSFATGESTSESLGRMLESMVSSGTPSQALADIEALKQATAQLTGKDVTGARASFDKISAKVRASKAALVVDVQIASEESEQAYLAAMERFARAFPDDPALLLQSIDRFFLSKDFAQTLSILDKLDQQLGGDPYLEVMRATAFTELGRGADAVAAAQRCAKAEPTLKSCWFALIGAQLAAKDHASVIPTMRELETRFELVFTPSSIGTSPEWAGFLASPEGKAWAAQAAEAEAVGEAAGGAEGN